MTITELLALEGLQPTPEWLDAYGLELRHACRMQGRCAAGACLHDCPRQIPFATTDPHNPDGLRLVYRDCPRKAETIRERVSAQEADATMAQLERFFSERYRPEQRRLLAEEMGRMTMPLLADVAYRAMHAFKRLPSPDELHRVAAAERQRRAQEESRSTPTLQRLEQTAPTEHARNWFGLIGKMLSREIPREQVQDAIAKQARTHRTVAIAVSPNEAAEGSGRAER